MPLTFRCTPRDDEGMLIEVPAEILKALGPARRPPVVVMLNGVELRTTIAVYGGKSYIGVRKEIRDAAGLLPGTSIDLSVELDTRPREVDVPPDLAAALDS